MSYPDDASDSSAKALPLGLVVLILVGVVAAMFFLAIPNCVVAGTLVATPDGPRAIETLEVGDAVWCRAPSGERVAGQVGWTRSATSFSHLELSFDDGTQLRVTRQHPISTPEGWIEAGELEPGILVHGENGLLCLATVEERSGGVTVCDLSVSPYPNFFAGGVLVHNKEGRIHSNEAAAVGALRTIGSAQLLFREGDVDGDGKQEYAKLAELGSAGGGTLLDAELASGKKNGYLFYAQPSTTTPESLWFATASPVEPGKSGSRYFCINQEGVPFYRTDRPFLLDVGDCEIPADATVVGN